jgi:hypothetical protein
MPALLLGLLLLGGDVLTTQEASGQRTMQIPNAQGQFVESGCGQANPDTCELRLIRAGAVIGSVLIPSESQLSADASGGFAVAIGATRAVRFRTTDMTVDRRVAYPRALVTPSRVLVGRGAARIFMLIDNSVVILNMDRQELFGTIDMKKERSSLLLGLEAVGLAAAAAAVVVAKPDALGQALARSSDRSEQRPADTELALTRNGEDVEIVYRPNGRVVTLDSTTGELLWDTHFRMR